MTKSIFARSMMFISTYFPLYILLLLFLWVDGISQMPGWEVWFLGVLFGLLILLSLGSVLLLKNVPLANYCKPQNVRYPDKEALHYLVTYLIPIALYRAGDFGSILTIFLWFLILWGMYIRCDCVWINPLWVLFGYTFYEWDGGCLITNIKYKDVLNYPKKLHGCYLTNRVFVAHKSNYCK